MKTILVVDDDVTVHDVLEEILIRDYKIIHAYDGRSGVKRYKKNRQQIALILLDMAMPDMSGIEVLRDLRFVGLGDIPVVMLTSVDDHEVESASIEAGAIDYIRKPINVKVMKARIAAHIALMKKASKSEIERIVKDRVKMVESILTDTLQIIEESVENSFDPALVNAITQLKDIAGVSYPS